MEKYYEAEGRRKTAVARTRLFTSKANTQKDNLDSPAGRAFLINEKPLEQYFPISELQQIARSSLEKMKCLDKFRVSVRVHGGGLKAQAEAVRHGTARALVLFNPDFRKRLKATGFLTRDPRMRERKKFGLKRARRAPQWQKR
ncbi:30S ribosomal protein S9 [Parcubacteria bacterium DG_74_1]|nr:MAG: 30S ribosomal protein S9 [Parcubacteria bacterium DG_74_1]